MPPSSRSLVWLLHIREETEACAEFVASRTFQDLETDRQLRYAIERALQRLTEAAYRLGDDGPKLLPDIDWAKIRGFGNVLRHEYDELENSIVWRSATEDVPRLRQEIEKLLRPERGEPKP